MDSIKKEDSLSNYSEAFKCMAASEFESELSSKSTLRRKHGISGHSGVSRWLKKYGKYAFIFIYWTSLEI